MKFVLHVLFIVLGSVVPLRGQFLDTGTGVPGTLTKEIKLLATITPTIHTGLGHCTAELGDLDGDGYDDYAVTSMLDTTFIFYGGDPIPELPRYYVLGGSGGVAAGDFNGDGYVDIATTIKVYGVAHDPDPELRGRIRIYYNTKADPPFHQNPDQIIRGPVDGYKTNGSSAIWGCASGDPWFQGIKSCDVNGDGLADMLTSCQTPDSTHVSRGFRYHMLFLGGDSLSHEPDALLLPPAFGDGKSHDYRSRYHTGDVNGDGCTDIMILGRYYDDYPKGSHVQWDMFLGNSEAVYGLPDYSIPTREDVRWFEDLFSMQDINNDGCDELISDKTVRDGNVLISTGCRSRTGMLPDDSLWNPDPDIFYKLQYVLPVGDMNGDGTRDVLISWGMEGFPYTGIYHFYPNGTGGSGKRSHGSFGLNHDYASIRFGAWPIGDVNGDGYDDVIMSGRPSDNPGSRYIRLMIWGGNEKLVSASAPPILPDRITMTLSPNPVQPGSMLQVSIESDRPRQGTLQVIDLLGRSVQTRTVDLNTGTNQVPLPAMNIPKGAYTVVFQSGQERSTTSMIVL